MSRSTNKKQRSSILAQTFLPPPPKGHFWAWPSENFSWARNLILACLLPCPLIFLFFCLLPLELDPGEKEGEPLNPSQDLGYLSIGSSSSTSLIHLNSSVSRISQVKVITVIWTYPTPMSSRTMLDGKWAAWVWATGHHGPGNQCGEGPSPQGYFLQDSQPGPPHSDSYSQSHFRLLYVRVPWPEVLEYSNKYLIPYLLPLYSHPIKILWRRNLYGQNLGATSHPVSVSLENDWIYIPTSESPPHSVVLISHDGETWQN